MEKSGQTVSSYLEFACDLTTHFSCWCSGLGANNFKRLSKLMLLEQFKSSIPVHVAKYISEQKTKTVAVLLIHQVQSHLFGKDLPRKNVFVSFSQT